MWPCTFEDLKFKCDFKMHLAYITFTVGVNMLLFQYVRLNIQMRLQKYIRPSDTFVPVAAHLDNKAGKHVLALTVSERIWSTLKNVSLFQNHILIRTLNLHFHIKSNRCQYLKTLGHNNFSFFWWMFQLINAAEVKLDLLLSIKINNANSTNFWQPLHAYCTVLKRNW